MIWMVMFFGGSVLPSQVVEFGVFFEPSRSVFLDIGVGKVADSRKRIIYPIAYHGAGIFIYLYLFDFYGTCRQIYQSHGCYGY